MMQEHNKHFKRFGIFLIIILVLILIILANRKENSAEGVDGGGKFTPKRIEMNLPDEERIPTH